MRALSQLGLLLWKNFVLQKRQFIWTICELLLPALLAIVLVFLRQQVVSSKEPESRYDPVKVTGTLLDFVRKVDNQSIYTYRFFPNFTFYAPETPVTNAVMENVKKRFVTPESFPRQFNITFIGFPSEEAMVEKLLQQFDNHSILTNPYLGGIVFSDDFAQEATPTPKTISYKIRLSNRARNPGIERDVNRKKYAQYSINNGWNTQRIFPLIQRIGPRERMHTGGGKPGYWREAFLTLQRAVDIGITEYLAPESEDFLELSPFTSKLQVAIRRFPYPEFVNNPFINVFQMDFPLIIMLSLSLSVLYISRNVVHEKEMRLKEYMRSMGLGRSLNWCAHFITNIIKLSLAMAITTVLLTVPISGRKIVDKTDPTLIFVFLLLYAASTIWFAFAVSTFFKKGNTAAASAGIIFFLLYVPYFFLQPRYGDLTFLQKIFSCLSINTAMAYGAQVIGIFEGQGFGVTWSTLNTPGTIDDDFTLLHVFAMLLVDLIIAILITWYVEAVNPGDQGTPMKLWFPFSPSCWCGEFEHVGVKIRKISPVATVHDSLHNEADPPNIQPEISIQQLTKIFGSGSQKLTAVDDLNMKLYPGQITALLGHNGAGKSTTVSMLTGLLPSSSGTVIISGFDMTTQLSQIRRLMGLCPQYNALYTNLTVKEHLKLFCKLKGRQWSHDEVTRLLKGLGLTEKKHALAGTLSGGMKRKLAVAIALIGGSEIVILDEPTSGMDPGARHEAWSLLQTEKRSRTMLLTTHYMEEADLLGDRIAILSEGQLRCSGSGLFLKNLYGSGYHLTVVFDKVQNQITFCIEHKAGVLHQVLQQFCPEAYIESTAGLEAKFLLPAQGKDKFQSMFAELEKQQTDLGVSSFGVSITTMEEVFLKVAHQARDDRAGTGVFSSQEAIGLGHLSDLKTPCQLQGAALYFQQFKAMVYKRAIHSSRNWMLLIAQFVVPVLLVFIAIMVNKMLPGPQALPALKLNLAPFGSPVTSIRRHENTSDLTKKLLLSYTKQLNPDALKFTSTDMDDFYMNFYGQYGYNVVNNQYIVGASFKAADSGAKLTAYFNNQPYHSPAISLNLLDNAIFTHFYPNSSIETVNHPLPPTSSEKVSDWLGTGMAEFNIAFNLMFGMAFLTSSFVVFLIKERESKAKHLQLLTGTHPLIFWASTYVWDFVNYMVPCLLIVVLLAGFQIEELISDNRWTVTLMLLVLYGWAVLPLMYLCSFLFSSAASGFVKMTIFNIVSGLITLTVYAIIYIFLYIPDIQDTLEWIFLGLFPNFCLGQAFNVFYLNEFVKKGCKPLLHMCANLTNLEFFDDVYDTCCNGSYVNNSLSWDPSAGIGRMPFFLTLQGIFYWILLYIVEAQIGRSIKYLITQKLLGLTSSRRTYDTLDDRTVEAEISGTSHASSGDEDVLVERQNVDRMNNTDALLISRQLTKFYGSLKAVDRLSFAVKHGDCFGLLGVNGAGKTSAFQMLTGEQLISKGNAYIHGCSVQGDWQKAGQHVGYCPQFDALIDHLTGAETLSLFARLKGVPESDLWRLISAVARTVDIEAQMKRLTLNYSGGNKRRLSLGIALMGVPQILLLDEPTTGVDVEARRSIWNILAQIRQHGTAIVLTSHSMEECEALCTKLAIMVSGRFCCLGSPQHIKSKYGPGYTLQIKIRKPEEVERAMNVVAETFSTCRLKERHNTQLSYEIGTAPGLSWSVLFSMVERMIQPLDIVHYSLSQTSLEQVFLRFAKGEEIRNNQPTLLHASVE